MENIYKSYNSAVIELQNSFFNQENTHRIYEDKDTYDTFYDLDRLDMENRLREVLLQLNRESALALSEELLSTLTGAGSVLPNQVKDLYYKLLTVIRTTYKILKIQAPDLGESDHSLWGYVSSCESVYELQELLKARLELLFSTAKSKTENNMTIYLIKEFIAGRYQDETLSVKDISDHVKLSSSYVCTLFKNDTGMTLNQYLTEYRIGRAKKTSGGSQV